MEKCEDMTAKSVKIQRRITLGAVQMQGLQRYQKESINLEYFENIYRAFGIFSFRLRHRLLKSTKFSKFQLKYI